jgi:hypothetical protein
MSPAAVNNSARQNMADLRSFANDLAWFKYGKGDQDYSPVYVGATQFKIAGADVSAVYHVGRRVRAVGSSTGTIYGYISVVAFSTDTTVTVVWDSGSLSNETLTISLSQIPVTGNPSPNPLIGTFTPTDGSGASLTFSSAVGIYRKFNGLVHVSMKIVYPATADGSNAKIGGLPFTALNAAFVGFPLSAILNGGGLPSANGFVLINTTTMNIIKAGGLAVTNADMSAAVLYINGAYPI